MGLFFLIKGNIKELENKKQIFFLSYFSTILKSQIQKYMARNSLALSAIKIQTSSGEEDIKISIRIFKNWKRKSRFSFLFSLVFA